MCKPSCVQCAPLLLQTTYIYGKVFTSAAAAALAECPRKENEMEPNSSPKVFCRAKNRLTQSVFARTTTSLTTKTRSPRRVQRSNTDRTIGPIVPLCLRLLLLLNLKRPANSIMPCPSSLYNGCRRRRRRRSCMEISSSRRDTQLRMTTSSSSPKEQKVHQ